MLLCILFHITYSCKKVFLKFFFKVSLYFLFCKKPKYSEQRKSSPFRPHTWECTDRLMWLMRISLLSNQLGVWHKEPLCLYLDLSLVWWVKKLPWPRVVFYLGKTKHACLKTTSGLGVNDRYQCPVLLNFQKGQNSIASLSQNLPICTPISTNMVICQI